MNNKRRKNLNNLIKKTQELKDILEALKDEEEEYKENIPENLQNSERYNISENACDNLDYAMDSFDEIISYIECAVAVE